MSFNKVLEKYRKISFSEKDKGDRFERLMKAYLLTDPKYIALFKKVWMWNEFPSKADLGGKDTGVDLVALTYNDEYWAIQCKCFSENVVIDKKSVDTFLSTSSRSFKDAESLKTTNFNQRLWISTTSKWTDNATEALKNQNPPVARLNIHDLINAPVDWEKLENNITGEQARTKKYPLKEHQKTALLNTHQYFKEKGRGKLIMACGTGKTFTSLRIAENETDGKGLILFLVPSIALLGQTLNEWSAQALEKINPICICSDPEITKKKTKVDDIDTTSVIDLALPASTNVPSIIKQFERLKYQANDGMTVVFSTYQSIEVIAKAQKEVGNIYPEFAEFDLIVCDEAHRTTGAKLVTEDESSFTKVHDNNFIRTKKRLYMTATPRLYDQETKSKAAKAEAMIWSMDDEDVYGEEIYRIGFGEAVEKKLLTDYKVLVLTLSENDVPPSIQQMIANSESEIKIDDLPKLIGCINALSKQVLGDEGLIKATDPNPMRRAVAFCATIDNSQKITETLNGISGSYIEALPEDKKNETVSVASKHIDGTMSATQREELLSWLKDEPADGESRILTNVRCLSEGVDVPSLDAVMFLSARNSQVDVVQSVGRVMRLSEGKQYGYIIIPVVIPSTVNAEDALSDNERFKVVWTVLNALRAHDDRFNATVNRIDLNKNKPDNILVGGSPISFDDDGTPINKTSSDGNSTTADIEKQLQIQFEQLQSAVFARMVQKVGTRRYWEDWAKSVGDIANRQKERILQLIANSTKHAKEFELFLIGLRKSINPSIQQQQAIDMLSQHIITKPVFEALFEGYSFVQNNPMSKSMQKMLDLLEEETIEEDVKTLESFYESVKMRASGIDNAEGKQKIIIELYDKFFKTAFPKMVEQLGIVYTPTEVVDFIIHSVADVLQKEFNRNISDENVHILDPFTGTGTFITRLLQSGVIRPEDLERKYKNEIHANEIVLLAYYIASINIESVFHDLTPDPNDGIGKEVYHPFDGICLTDTFQLGEEPEEELNQSYDKLNNVFLQNSERVENQKKTPVRIIIGNPPYSIGQKSANDNAQNQSYPKLDKRIADTYAKLSNAGLNKSLYDAYIKAFRWSTDRLDPKHGGIIAFVSNGAWLDGNSTDGFRKAIEDEFSSIYVFNLRGNQRTSGELSRKEGGKIFGSGSRTPIAITLLVKNPDTKNKKATIHYHDIGDYLDTKQKLQIVKDFKTFDNTELPLQALQPNEHGDWISMRNDSFENYIPLAPEKKFDARTQTIFNLNVIGVSTNRDAWVYNFSKEKISENMQRMIAFYNEQTNDFTEAKIINPKLEIDTFIDTNPQKISWTVNLKKDLEKTKIHSFSNNEFKIGIYRPFTKQHLYFHKPFIERAGLNSQLFPTEISKNVIMNITGIGASKDFSVVISNNLTGIDTIEKNQIFPLYYYEENNSSQKGLFDDGNKSEYIRRDAISNFIYERAKKQYGKNVTKEDIFYYVYGFLHSKGYKETFANDLKKMLPRLPLVDDMKDFWVFSNSGRKLAELHLNYETVAPFAGVKLTGDDGESYIVEKLRFPKKDQKDTIIYNSKIMITNIPAEAYEYIVNGKSAIEWVMERYKVIVNKDSGITNNPNDWATEVGNPRYILDLLLSIINVSVQTVDIVGALPKINFIGRDIVEIEPNDIYLKPNEKLMKSYTLHDPIYNIQDVVQILRLGKSKIVRWFDELHNSDYQYPGISYVDFGGKKELRISFHGLIELAAIKDLRENNIPLKDIVKARTELIERYKVDYPFASEKVLSCINKAGKKLVLDDGYVLDLGGTKQLNLDFIKDLFKKIEFEKGLASRLYPMSNTKNIVVDPTEAGGKAFIAGSDGTWVEMIVSVYKTYQDIDRVTKEYDVTSKDVEDSLKYYEILQN
ncbi:DEAD/DEAH box helicase family protein [Agrobacterium tumefaciens]|nr:DEAD/DEAH box helicase family protein [Agrobacterium tumefaciens]NTE25348.1 DEAD/DEAH box helicase family protein [Agrobacterium tumefaciens]